MAELQQVELGQLAVVHYRAAEQGVGCIRGGCPDQVDDISAKDRRRRRQAFYNIKIVRKAVGMGLQGCGQRDGFPGLLAGDGYVVDLVVVVPRVVVRAYVVGHLIGEIRGQGGRVCVAHGSIVKVGSFHGLICVFKVRGPGSVAFDVPVVVRGLL